MAKLIKDLTIGDTFNGLPVKSVDKKYSIDGKNIIYDVTLEGSLEKITKDTFSTSETAIELDLPSTVTSISDNAFNNCSNLETIDLSEVSSTVVNNTYIDSDINAVIPSGTKLKVECTYPDYIYGGGFYGELDEIEKTYTASALRRILNHKYLIYESLFYNAMIFDHVNTWYSLKKSTKTFTRTTTFPRWYLDTDIEATIMSPGEKEIWYITGDNLPLKFRKSFLLSKSDPETGADAFTINSDCIDTNTYTNSIGKIKLKDDYTEELLQGLFGKLTSLLEVYIGSGIPTLPKYMFRECTNLYIAFMPDSVTSLGWGTFYACLNLKHLRLSNNITILPKYSLFTCLDLQAFNVPTSLETIEEYALGQCNEFLLPGFPYYPNPDALHPYGIHEDGSILTVLSDDNPTGELENDTNIPLALQWFTIPKTLKTIKPYAFYNCNLAEAVMSFDDDISSLPTAETETLSDGTIVTPFEGFKVWEYAWVTLAGENTSDDPEEIEEVEYVSFKHLACSDTLYQNLSNKYLSTYKNVYSETTDKIIFKFTGDDYGWKQFNGMAKFYTGSLLVTYINSVLTKLTVRNSAKKFSIVADFDT